MLLVRQLPRSVSRNALRDFLQELSRRLARGREIDCLLTGDRELRRLNREFLGHDYPTDVLSFPRALRRDSMERVSRAQPAPLGEIAISVDRARAQAAQHGHSLADEVRILMLHGALHLAGFDHASDSGEMARAEARWRKRFGLPASLIERAAALEARP